MGRGRIGTAMQVEGASCGNERTMSRTETRYMVRHRREWVGADGVQRAGQWAYVWPNSALGAAKYAIGGRWWDHSIRDGRQAVITSKAMAGEASAVMVREIFIDKRQVEGDELRRLFDSVKADALQRKAATIKTLKRLDTSIAGMMPAEATPATPFWHDPLEDGPLSE